MRAKAWLKAEDFDKGLAVARTRHPQPRRYRRRQLRRRLQRSSPIAPPLPPKPGRPATVAAAAATSGTARVLVSPQPSAIEPPKQESPDLQMKIDGGAKFARPWRVWMKKT